MSQQEKLHLKVYIGRGKAEIRRCTLDVAFLQRWTSDQALHWLVRNCVSSSAQNSSPSNLLAQQYSLTFMDDEGDWCTVRSDIEWLDAVRIASNSDSKLLRMRLKPNESSETSESEHPFWNERRHMLRRGWRNRRGAIGGCRPPWSRHVDNDRPGHATLDITNLARQYLPRDILGASNGNEQDGDDVVHYGIICDGCEQTPLKGIRYRCKHCRGQGYDLCSECFKSVDVLHHHKSHQFEAIGSEKVHSAHDLANLCRKFTNIVPHIIYERPQEQEQEEEKKKQEQDQQANSSSAEASTHKEQPTNEKEEKEKNVVKSHSQSSDDSHKTASIDLTQQEREREMEEAEEIGLDEEREKTDKNEDVEPPIPSAPEVSPSQAQASSPYMMHLNLLRQMGFTDDKHSIELLTKHEGNLQRVLNEYLN